MNNNRKDFFLKKKESSINKKFENISLFNLKLIHKVLDTVNISLLIFIFVLSFLSLDSQRKWSKTYKILSKTKTLNFNLIDYISQTEEFYISDLESFNNFKKATPKDLIYLEGVLESKENYINKKIKKIFKGIKDSRYLRGY